MNRPIARALRMTGFAFSVFALPFVYLSLSLVGDDYARWPLVAAPFALLLATPLALFTGDRARPSWWRDALTRAIHLTMAALSYALVAAPARDLVMLAGGPRFGNAWVFAATALALALGGLIARFGLVTREVAVPIENLDPALEGYRIVQISDLHSTPSLGAARVEALVSRAERLAPDLVALTGDIGDADPRRAAAPLRALARLAPPDGTYFVPGNHEYYWGVDAWNGEVRRLGARVLLNESSLFKSRRGAPVCVAGVTDPAAREFGGAPPDLGAAARGLRADALKILLSHRPGPAPAAAAAGFDLQLSGHTHGGQFVPWTLVVHLVHRYVSGLRRAGRMWVYVSVGTGTWGPAQRLGTRPELTLLTLVRATKEKCLRPGA